jgi:flagella basal body P-ring formation protein FlgA
MNALNSIRLVACLLLCAAARADSPAEMVVSLRPSVFLRNRTITVGNVADIAGGTAALRDTIARLDLAELLSSQTGTTITRKQLEYRLRLGEFSSEMVQVAGSPQTQVTLQLQTVSPEEVVDAAKSALMQRLPWSPGQVEVNLLQPVVVTLPELAEGERVVIKAEMHPGVRPPGRVQMDVGIFVQGTHRLSLPVYLDVRVCQKVVVCREQIDSGEELSEANIYIDQRPLPSGSTPMASPNSAIGRKARRSLLPGQVITANDLEAVSVQEDRILVRAGEPVHIEFKVGSLRVTGTGVAMQQGRKDQLIQVQNVDSKKTVLGRVRGTSLVEVE